MVIKRIYSILGALLLLGCSRKPESAAAPVTIFAASSLREVVTEIAAGWSTTSGRPHRLQFEATSTLARQVAEGAPADLLITAAPEWLDKVKTEERFDWLGNRLVVVVRQGAREVDLRRLESLALANEQVPVGKYARQAMAREGLQIPERVIYGQNVREVLSRVSHGGAAAGIVYATDARIDPDVRVVHTFAATSHDRIVYSAGLLKPGGRALYDALREAWALEIARRHGFSDLK